MISLDALYAGTLAAASGATSHLGPLGSLADRLADRVLPQAVAKAESCECPKLLRKWMICDHREESRCTDLVQSCGAYIDLCDGNRVCSSRCYCTSTSCA